MSAFDRVTAAWGDLVYMDEARAAFLRELVRAQNLAEVLELGFAHGKSSAYIAAILEDEGRGHLTTIDLEAVTARTPAIGEVLAAVGLTHRVTPILAARSYTWELSKLLRRAPRPQFDLCYFDGGHTWDQTGFGFLLTDMLLRPGGWIVFDDLNWTINRSLAARGLAPEEGYKGYSADEKEARGVRMVFDLLVPHLGYVNAREEKRFRWGVAQKPARRGLRRWWRGME